MDDLDRHLEKLGEADAAWEPLPGFTAGGVAEVCFEADVLGGRTTRASFTCDNMRWCWPAGSG